MKKKITAFLFLLFLVGMAVAGLVKPDRSFSEQENRYLQTWPGISAASVADGSFMSRLETYLTDQSPLRDGMVRLHNSLLRWTGRREIQQVYFAPENRLIQLYDTNLTQARQNMEWINRWAEAWQGTQPISLVLAPTAAVVYRDQLPECNLGYDAEALTAMLQVGVSPDIRLVDLQAVMQEHRQEAIYFRSDHHWTMRGKSCSRRRRSGPMRHGRHPIPSGVLCILRRRRWATRRKRWNCIMSAKQPAWMCRPGIFRIMN